MRSAEPTSETSTSEPRLIKRYANRKLYDTRDSQYVTLHQIAELVREGEEVKIIDNKSKEDLTNVTLAQIIYEEEKKGDSEIRRSTLLAFIQDGQKRLIDSLPVGLSKLVRSEKSAGDESGEIDAASEGDKVDRNWDRSGRRQGAARVSADRRRPLDSIGELKGLADDRVRALLGGAIGHVRDLQSEVKRLQGRIEELEHKIAGLLKRKSDPPRD